MVKWSWIWEKRVVTSLDMEGGRGVFVVRTLGGMLVMMEEGEGGRCK